jgi:hypothetical protein
MAAVPRARIPDRSPPVAKETAMNRIHRCLGVVAALGGALLTLAVAAPAALATIPDPGGGPVPGTGPAMPSVVTGGMSGWQITLIAAGAALVAAIAAVLLDRAWAARRSVAARAG